VVGDGAAEEGTQAIEAAVDADGGQADAAEALALVGGAVLQQVILDGVDVRRELVDDVVDAFGRAVYHGAEKVGGRSEALAVLDIAPHDFGCVEGAPPPAHQQAADHDEAEIAELVAGPFEGAGKIEEDAADATV